MLQISKYDGLYHVTCGRTLENLKACTKPLCWRRQSSVLRGSARVEKRRGELLTFDGYAPWARDARSARDPTGHMGTWVFWGYRYLQLFLPAGLRTFMTRGGEKFLGDESGLAWVLLSGGSALGFGIMIPSGVPRVSCFSCILFSICWIFQS